MAWVLVLLPSQKPKTPFGRPGLSATRRRGRLSSRSRPSNRGGPRISSHGGLSNRGGLNRPPRSRSRRPSFGSSFRPSISGAVKNAGGRMRPSATPLGFPTTRLGSESRSKPSGLGYARGGFVAPQNNPPQVPPATTQTTTPSVTPPVAQPELLATPRASFETPHGVRRAIPISTADASLRRRDITVILAAAALITLIALFFTQQVWLGVLHLGFDAALFGYLWLVSRCLHLYSNSWPDKRSS